MKLSGLILITLLLTVNLSMSQEDQWDVYLASYDGETGSVMVNMSLINLSPNRALPFILITGVKFSNCNSDGLPNDSEFNKLYSVSDGVFKLVKRLTKVETAGTFSYQCERLDYLYVKDTMGLREGLSAYYSEKHPEYDAYVNIKTDQNWEVYSDFLYPNEQIREYMSNQSVLQQLISAGDDLSKKRQIDHWLYFKDARSRDQFVTYAQEKKFKAENQSQVEGELPFQLHISRVDSINQPSLDQLTLSLRKKAISLNGKYDGWETYVIKD